MVELTYCVPCVHCIRMVETWPGRTLFARNQLYLVNRIRMYGPTSVKKRTKLIKNRKKIVSSAVKRLETADEIGLFRTYGGGRTYTINFYNDLRRRPVFVHDSRTGR